AAAIKVTAQLEGAGQSFDAHTDQSGAYQFPALPVGTYTVRAAAGDSGVAVAGPVTLRAHDVRKVDLTLEYAFLDEPNFIVTGVTDTASRGGHGSDVVLRSAEAIAKATASLGKQPPAEPSTEESMRQAIERQPGDADPHHSLADYEESHGRPLEAVREYQRAAQLEASERNLFDWGAELLVHRAPVPAATVFTKGHRLFPRSARMLLGLAAAWYARGVYDQAATYFFAACDLNPRDPGPYLFLGKVQSAEITQLPGYAERLGRFAGFYPGNAWANYYYAASLWKQRKGPEDTATAARVRRMLEKAVRIDGHLAVAYLQLGVVSYEQRDYVSAIAWFQKAVAVSPELEEAHYRLGQAYGRTGEAEKARRELEAYQKMSRASSDAAQEERTKIHQFVVEQRGTPPPR
ncbi:MAG TPA: tetratricopeptide repeat protein, partial [Bryobacteraceae bacterium]|nr:tetratricopeptide repeat protein [Bryobacteraceae bacterium]